MWFPCIFCELFLFCTTNFVTNSKVVRRDYKFRLVCRLFEMCQYERSYRFNADFVIHLDRRNHFAIEEIVVDWAPRTFQLISQINSIKRFVLNFQTNSANWIYWKILREPSNLPMDKQLVIRWKLSAMIFFSVVEMLGIIRMTNYLNFPWLESSRNQRENNEVTGVNAFVWFQLFRIIGSYFELIEFKLIENDTNSARLANKFRQTSPESQASATIHQIEFNGLRWHSSGCHKQPLLISRLIWTIRRGKRMVALLADMPKSS